MFFGYAIIDANTDSHRLFIDTARITDDLRKYLKDGNAEIILEEYQTVFSEVKQEADNNRKIWISPLSSYAVYNSVSNKENLINKNSPIRSIKARKTETEIKNIRTCQVIIIFYYFLVLKIFMKFVPTFRLETRPLEFVTCSGWKQKSKPEEL